MRRGGACRVSLRRASLSCLSCEGVRGGGWEGRGGKVDATSQSQAGIAQSSCCVQCKLIYVTVHTQNNLYKSIHMYQQHAHARHMYQQHAHACHMCSQQTWSCLNSSSSRGCPAPIAGGVPLPWVPRLLSHSDSEVVV